MKFKIRINSKGQKIKKLRCPPGQKAQNGRCVVMKSLEKISRKKSAKRAVRTKNAKGSIKRAALRAFRKALKKRKQRGL